LIIKLIILDYQLILLSFHESSGNINPTRLHWYEKYLNQSDSDYNRIACSLVNLCDFLSFAVDTILPRPSLVCPRKDDWILLLMAQTFYSNKLLYSIPDIKSENLGWKDSTAATLRMSHEETYTKCTQKELLLKYLKI